MIPLLASIKEGLLEGQAHGFKGLLYPGGRSGGVSGGLIPS